MATIRPLFGLRYSPDAGPLEDLTAPPYDVLSPAQRDAYAAKSKHNIVWLTLPESEEGDRSQFVKYARSAARLNQWRQESALHLEAKPAFYRTFQDFRLEENGPILRRTALVVLLKVEPYAKGVVLPHEQTFPKHKEDRLRILEATRSHLESIFGLYEDESETILRTILNAPSVETVTCRSEDGVFHTIEPIEDENAIAELSALVASKKIWIADGHHRYETALGYREAFGPKDSLIPEDFILISLSSMNDPGLVLLPTHRMVHNLNITPEDHLARLSRYFTVEETKPETLTEVLSRLPLSSFGLAMPENRAYILNLNPNVDLNQELTDVTNRELRQLDVTVLHKLIFEKILEIHGLDQISYTRSAQEAIEYPGLKSQCAYLMNPPSVENMRTLALLGEKMPQKSTYYYPKLLSGAVLWSLNDF